MLAHHRDADKGGGSGATTPHYAPSAAGHAEPHFTLRQALHTRAFWVLALFAALGFMAQAGVNLHQVSHYIRQGFPASMAAMMASFFAVAQVPAGLGWSALTRRVPFDRTGRYEHAFLGLAGLVLLGSLLVLSAVPPQQPDRP